MNTERKVIIGIVITVIAIFIILVLMSITKEEKIEKNNHIAIEDDCINEEYMYETGYFENDLEASSAEKKVSPNAKLIIKKKYKGCGHITEKIVELPSEIINKTQEEIEKMYPDFEVDSFSSEEIILYKEDDGECNEHFKIKEEDGVIVIYNTNENGEEELYEKTGIATEYLAKADIDSIKNGLEIYGKENLNKFIEDFE